MIRSVYEDFESSAIIATEIYEALKNYDTSNLKLIMRHSIRGDIRKGDSSYDIPLTREGRILAKNFAKNLKFRLNDIYTSKVGRCVETSEIILNEYKKINSVHFEKIKEFNLIKPHHALNVSNTNCSDIELGKLNIDIIKHDAITDSYVDDLSKAMSVFDNEDSYSVMSNFLKGNKLNGFKSLKETTKTVFNFLIQDKNIKNNSAYIDLYVTHDTFLTFIACICAEIIPSYDNFEWPYMLEGLFLFRCNETIICIFREKVYKISMRSLDLI